MARTKIDVFDVGLNGSIKITPVNLDATNGMYFSCDERDSVTLVVTNSDSANGITVTIKGAGNNSDKAFTVGKSETVAIGNLESAKFKQTGAVINVDIGLAEGATASGKIYGVQDLI